MPPVNSEYPSKYCTIIINLASQSEEPVAHYHAATS
jgi:hypothetical protein